MSLMFRMAETVADTEVILPLAREAHEESRYGDIPFSDEKFRKRARAAVEKPDAHGVMIAEKNGVPVGWLYITAGEYMVGTGAILATIHTIFVRPEARKRLSGGKIANGLLNGALNWARARNAREVTAHVTSGTDIARPHKFSVDGVQIQ